MQMCTTKILIKQQPLVYKFTMAMELAKINLNRVIFMIQCFTDFGNSYECNWKQNHFDEIIHLYFYRSNNIDHWHFKVMIILIPNSLFLVIQYFCWGTIRSFLCVPLGIIGINACILLKLRNRIYNALLCYQYCLNIHVIQVVDTENCDTPTSSLTHINSRKNFADKNHQMIFTHVL